VDTEYAQKLGPRSRVALVAASGAVMFSTFWVLVSLGLNPRISIVYNVKGARYGGPLTWPSRLFHLASLAKGERTALYILLMVLLTLGYLATIYLVRGSSRRSITLVIAGGFLAFSMLFLFAPPFLSRDIYSYAFGGRAMSVYHANPYLAVPSAYRSDVLFPLIGWKNQASVYGPLFGFVSYMITKLAGNSVPANVLGFKVLAFVSFAACLPFLYSMSRRVAPGRENMALSIAAWSPMLMLHVCGGGHNETVMVFFVLAGFYACWKGRSSFGLLLVLLAAMVKISAVLALVPYLVYYLFREKEGRFWPRAATSAATVVALPLLMYAPFWGGTRIFSATLRMTGIYSVSSIPMLARTYIDRALTGVGLSGHMAASLSNGPVRAFFLLLLIGVTVVLLLRIRDRRTMAAATAGIALLWFLTSSYILPWYLALGLLVTGIAGWNATTGCLVAASSLFAVYRMPLSSVPILSRIVRTGIPGPNLPISIPLTVILIVWLILIHPLRRAGPADEASPVHPSAEGEAEWMSQG